MSVHEIVKNKLLYIICLIVFIIDFISKLFIISVFEYKDIVVVIKNLFNVTYVKNMGGAFSVFDGNVLFIEIITIIILFILYKYLKDKKLSVYELWGYGLIIGGAVGNLFDRIIYGYVIDFLDFYVFGYDFPVFNIADCGIVIGVLILIFCEVRDKNGNNGRRKIENR